jgi:hypothetical protein
MEEVLGDAAQEDGDSPNGMPGKLTTEKEGKGLHGTLKAGIRKIKYLVVEKVTIKTQNNGAMTWTAISSHDPSHVIPEKEHNEYGLKSFKCGDYKRSEVLCLGFLKLLFED